MLEATLIGVDGISRHILANSSCVLPISLGKKEHENEQLAATLVEVTKTFKHVTVVVADTLQAYTRQITNPSDPPLSLEEQKEKLRQDGKAWVERNQAALCSSGKEIEVIHWDTFLTANFQEKLVEIQAKYVSDSVFKRAVDTTVKGFLGRLSSKAGGFKPEFHSETNLSRSTEYMLEECAVFLNWGYNFVVYPYKLPSPLTHLLSDIHSKDGTILIPLQVKCNVVAKSSPQSIKKSLRAPSYPEGNSSLFSAPVRQKKDRMSPSKEKETRGNELQYLLIEAELAHLIEQQIKALLKLSRLDRQTEEAFEERLLSTFLTKLSEQKKEVSL